MHALLIHSGEEAYGLDIREVQEVIPRVQLRALRWAPPYIAGLLSYRGTVVPVIDLCQISQGRACEPRLSSRIVLVKYQTDPLNQPKTLGLLAERVTEIVEISEERIQEMGVGTEEAPHLGKVAMDRENMVQFVRVDALLPAEIRERLFTEAVS